MNMQSLLIRATFMAVLTIGLALALMHTRAHKPSITSIQSRGQTVAKSVAASAVAESATAYLLPTITVRPEVILVRSSNEIIQKSASAKRVTESNNHKFYVALKPAQANLHLDMPYYSFGRSMSNVSKE